MSDQELQQLDLPSLITPAWIAEAQATLLKSTWKGVDALKQVLPKNAVTTILDRTERLVHKEASLVEIAPPSPDASVVVVGDTHGQFHDVCQLFDVAGQPSESRLFIFNGDFVDRGAWGIETLVLFCLWKLALPHRVFLLRGNHETATCSILYGFKGELEAKYGKTAYKGVFASCKKLFASLPLAAVVNGQTLVLHGGLFRKPVIRGTGKSKRKRADDGAVGDLNDLKKASKGGLDPSGLGASRLAADVQWSDPTKTPGFLENDARGVGMIFGPEITGQFLRDNNLKLILRSHEGPDARDDREDMGNMLEGFTEDHVTPAGKLYTVFSAPDYPQFMAEGAQRYRNKAAVAVLSAPNYDVPAMKQFEAVHPRPEARPYYDLFVNDSDEELEPVPSTVSGMTDVKAEKAKEKTEEEVGSAAAGAAAGASGGAEAEEEHDEVKKQAAVESPPRKRPISPKNSPRVGSGSGSETPRAHARGSSPTKWHPHASS